MKFLRKFALLLVSISIPQSLLSPSAKGQQGLPDGGGKEVVLRMCTPCHGLDSTVNTRMSTIDWIDTVDSMLSRGAFGTEEEIDIVVDYLATHFGKPVNVNKATAREIQAGLSLSSKDAEAIVKHRKENGRFKAMDDLVAVSGLDAEKIEKQKANIVF